MKKYVLPIFMVMVLLLLSTVTGLSAMVGDLNDDGVINIHDCIMMAEYIVGPSEEVPLEIADLNGDGTVSIHDLILMARYIVGEINEFPVEQEIEGVDFIVAEPVNPDTTEEARALLNYLHTIYGEKMLSGQMESGTWGGGPESDNDYVYQYSGKLPAMRGLDFIHENDNHNVVQRSIDWWEQGGIPTIMWHWGAPTVGEGYENSQEEIDVEAALTPGTSEHEAMMDDLDRIADYLEELRDANIPILWRPFHEFDGEWFWWGMDGPELFVELWQFMFDYYVNERDLNNLIWVLCHSSHVSEEWYPGDEYVDLSGADMYDVGPEPLTNLFNNTRKIVGLNVPVTYHECAIMPDPEMAKEEDVMWSWFMTWHTDWLYENSPEHIDYVYNHEYVITLDEVPDIMDYAGDGESAVARVDTMADGRGSIERSVEDKVIDKGSTVELTAIPEEGWEFAGWSGTNISDENPVQITVNDNVGLIANFEPDSGTNLLVNGDFSDGLSSWSHYIFEDQGAQADIREENGECVIDITGGGNELYHVQLIYPGITLEEGETYEFSFDVYADSAREMFVKFGQDGGDYLEYFGDTYEIGTVKDTISATFTMEESTDQTTRLELNVGHQTDNVYIDNVTLSIVD